MSDEYFDLDDFRQRLVGLESRVFQSENGEMVAGLSELWSEHEQLQYELENFETDLKRNLERLNDCLRRWGVTPGDLPVYRWGKK